MMSSSRLALAAIVAVTLTAAARADEGVQLIEQKIKAGLIYNFLKYTQWPQGSRQTTGPVVVCMLGGDAFDGHLKPIAGRTVNERTNEVREVGTAAEAAPCSLLIVNASHKADWPQLRTALANQSIVTVSDIDGFTGQGGMIEFTHTDNRVGVA